REIYLAGHFTRADIPAFSDFSAMIQYMSAVRKTFLSIDSHIPVEFIFGDEDEIEVEVHIRDTMLLTPASSKSLKAMGAIVGVEKIALDSDPARDKFYKENMDVLLKDNPSLFETYAINDAVICVKYIDQLIGQYRELFGKTQIPVTLTSIGVDLLWKTWKDKLKLNPDYLIGKEKVEERRFNKRRGYFEKVSRKVDMMEVDWHLPIATECFHGGRNEQFWFGPAFEDDWTDYDLTSAYPTAMALIGLPEWRKIHVTKNLAKFTPATLGVCCVDFKFKKSVRFPTLPVRTQNGLVFPRTGTSYCAAPEVALARELGATLKIRHGVIVPTNSDVRIFRDFTKECLENRSKYPKNSLKNLFWKELSNSSYGKTAQGLREKRVYDLRERMTKPLPPSRITNAFFASYITSFVRAVLGETMNNLPEDVCVFSCTTDGFLTNAKPEDMSAAKHGPLVKLYQESRFGLTGEAGDVEIKHRIRQPIGWRTRGQATLKRGVGDDDESNFVLAKGGIYLPEGMEDKADQNAYILDLFMKRTPERMINTKIFTGIRDMVELDTDLVQKNLTKRLSMEYDWKRCPYAVKQANDPDHVAFSTRHWDSIHEFMQLRDYVESYPKERRCIKSAEDFSRFATYVFCKSSLGVEDSKYLASKSPDITRLRRSLGSAWRNSQAGLVWREHEISNSQFAEILTNCGIPCERSDVENDSKKKFKPYNCPPSEGVMLALKRLSKEFPALVMEDLLVQSEATIDLSGALSTKCPHLARVA
ncbi:MAG: DNA polymerase, partial [Nitrospirales bacterium]